MADPASKPHNPPFGRVVTLSQGYQMHYHDHGSGPVVVFLHGSGPGANAWTNFFLNYEPIARAGHRVLMVDMLGFGWSSKPTGIDYTTQLFASTVVELLDKLGIERFDLIGNSLGGAVSLRITLDHPQRVGKLVLMGTGGIESRETYFKMPGIVNMVSRFVGEGFSREQLRAMLHDIVVDKSIITDELLEQRWNVLQTQPKDVLSRMIIPDVTEELPRIQCPVLGFWGIEDLFCPASGHAKVLKAVPDSRFILYSRCGHWAMIERLQDFNRHVIEFLAG